MTDFNYILFLKIFWPTIFLISGALILMLTSIMRFPNRMEFNGYIATTFFLASLLGFWFNLEINLQSGIADLWTDPYASFLGIIICLIGALCSLMAVSFFRRQEEQIAEFYSLLLFSAAGMCLMLQTSNLLVMIFALEVMSLVLYVIVAIMRHQDGAVEAAFKYFIMGSVASSLMLLGLAFVYGTTQSFHLSQLASIAKATIVPHVLDVGLLLILIGFAFKVGAVPFHFWAPDVYSGATYSVTAFMATAVKVTAIGALLRVIYFIHPIMPEAAYKLLALLSMLSILLGSASALRQTRIKRILAYSSIAHAGYLLLGCLAYTVELRSGNAHTSAIIYYLLTYTIMTLGAFAVLSTLSKQGEEVQDVRDLSGLATRKPVLAACLAIFLFSLAGIPPTAGFFAKFYLFKYALQMGLLVPVIIAALGSVISFYYYVDPVVKMYFKSEDKETFTWISPMFLLMVLALAASVIYVGIWPNNYLQLAKTALMAYL